MHFFWKSKPDMSFQKFTPVLTITLSDKKKPQLYNPTKDPSYPNNPSEDDYKGLPLTHKLSEKNSMSVAGPINLPCRLPTIYRAHP